MKYRIIAILSVLAGMALLGACGDKANETNAIDTNSTTTVTVAPAPTLPASVAPASTSTPTPTSTSTTTAASSDCGPVQTVEPNQKIVLMRGVTCETAKRALRQWDAYQAGGQRPDDSWACAMGRSGDGYNLVCATEFPEGTKAKDSAKNAFIVVDQ